MATMTAIKHIFIYLLSFAIGSYCFALNWWLWTRGLSVLACATIQLESTFRTRVSTLKTSVILRSSILLPGPVDFISLLCLTVLSTLHSWAEGRSLSLCWPVSSFQEEVTSFWFFVYLFSELGTLNNSDILASCLQTHRHTQMSPQSFLVIFFSV